MLVPFSPCPADSERHGIESAGILTITDDQTAALAALSLAPLLLMAVWRVTSKHGFKVRPTQASTGGCSLPKTLKRPSRKTTFYADTFVRLWKVGLGWVDFHVMRRTHSSLMRDLGVDPKIVADQQGHTLDVNLNVYAQTSLERRIEAVETPSQRRLLNTFRLYGGASGSI